MNIGFFWGTCLLVKWGLIDPHFLQIWQIPRNESQEMPQSIHRVFFPGIVGVYPTEADTIFDACTLW
jgi:hypothetical protein